MESKLKKKENNLKEIFYRIFLLQAENFLKNVKVFFLGDRLLSGNEYDICKEIFSRKLVTVREFF